MLRTGWVVVRRTTRVSPSASSMASVVSETWTVTVRWAWTRPRAIFWPQIMITPLFEARRCVRTGSIDGRGGGPAGRTEIFPHLSYTMALGAFRLGMGAAVSLVFFPVLVLLIIFLTRRMLRPTDE